MPASLVETGIIFYPLMITGYRNFYTYTIIRVL